MEGKSLVAVKTRERSPDYPAFSLQEAVSFVKLLYDKDKFTAIPTEIAVQHMGYASLNGASRTALSAMRKFGLVVYSAGSVKLSDLSHDIVLPRDKDEKSRAISTALLTPELYQRVLAAWPKWKLPSEATLKSILVRDWGFSPQGVNSFLSNLQESLDYVKSEVGTLPGGETDSQGADDEVGKIVKPSNQEDRDVVTEGNRATQRIPMPNSDLYLVVWKEMDKREARRIIYWLDNVVKPALKLASGDIGEEDFE